MPLPTRQTGTSATVPVLLGATKHGQRVTIDFTERVHLLIQGCTGSGKSRLSYAILQQLAAARYAIVVGSDPSCVLLRPFEGSRHAPWQVLGSDVETHAAMLGGLVDGDGPPARRDPAPRSTQSRLRPAAQPVDAGLRRLLGRHQGAHHRIRIKGDCETAEPRSTGRTTNERPLLHFRPFQPVCGEPHPV
jgi:hypothetical protein